MDINKLATFLTFLILNLFGSNSDIALSSTFNSSVECPANQEAVKVKSHGFGANRKEKTQALRVCQSDLDYYDDWYKRECGTLGGDNFYFEIDQDCGRCKKWPNSWYCTARISFACCRN